MFSILKSMWSDRTGSVSLEEKVPGMLSSAAFHAECCKEKMRADRTLVPFTLLIFDVRNTRDDGRARQQALEMLALVVRDTSRGSDTKGWHRVGEVLQIGLVLHNTKADKCPRVIREVQRTYHSRVTGRHLGNGHAVEVTCEVSSYPNPAAEAGPLEQPEERHDAGLLQRERATPPEQLAIVQERLLTRSLPWWKRTTDIVVSMLAVMMLSPLLILAALLIKAVSPGPIFFRQQRVGYLGRSFTLWKFRTMHVHFDQKTHERHLANLISGDGKQKKLDDHNPQIIPLGKLLRKSCLDELPQLFNVLFGEMSLVGPRPPIPYEVKQYLRWHSMRFDAVPGMTGLWQVSGKNETTFKEMIRLDIRYACRRSFLLDIKIILMTFPVVFGQMFKNVGNNRSKVFEAKENA